jgi:hypothetical protein
MTPRTVEIPRPDWMSALNTFSAVHQGWLVSIEILSAALGAQPEVVNLPLVGITLGAGNGGSVAISVGRTPGDHLTHVVQAPQRISIERTAAGADVALAIESADGSKTILRFRTAALPETVDGVARP